MSITIPHPARPIFWEATCEHTGIVNTNAVVVAELERACRVDHDHKFPGCKSTAILRHETRLQRQGRIAGSAVSV